MVRVILFIALLVLSGSIKGDGLTNSGRNPACSSDIAFPAGYRIELDDLIQYLKVVHRTD